MTQGMRYILDGVIVCVVYCYFRHSRASDNLARLYCLHVGECLVFGVFPAPKQHPWSSAWPYAVSVVQSRGDFMHWVRQII